MRKVIMFESTVFIDEKVNCEKVINFMRECRKNQTDIHSFEIIHNGKAVVRIASAPCSFEYKQQVYSLSKSFTSTAIGFLVDEGRVSIDDRLVDIFSDVITEKIGTNAKKSVLNTCYQ